MSSKEQPAFNNMHKPLRILIVEDSESDVLLLLRALRREGCEVHYKVVETAVDMRAALESQDWDVITSDHAMPRFSAPEALALARELRPDLPFIIVSGEIDLNLAVSLMKGGAKDYVQKRELPRIMPVINRALKEVETRIKRREVEEALRESELRWQFALEGAGDGVWDWDAETDRVFFSRQWKEMLGFEEHEIGDTLEEWDKRVHPDDKDQVYEEIRRHFAGETPIYISTHRVRCKDGSYKWIMDRGKIITRTASGKPKRVIGTQTDMTVHKEVEEALRERVKELKTLYAITEFAEKMTSVEDFLQKVADQLPQGWRYPERAVARITWKDREFKSGKYEETAPKLSAALKASGETLGAVELCYPEMLPDGDGGPFLPEEIFLINEVAKRLGRVIERTEAEKKLQESMERFRTFFNMAPEYFYMISPNGRIMDINKSALAALGCKREELLGKPLMTTIYAPSCRRKAEELFAKWKEQGYLKDEEMVIVGKSGQERTVLLSAAAIRDAKGSLLHSISIQRDITERKQVDRERDSLVSELQKALSEVKTLSGLLPICAACKKIRDDKGYWNQIESYIKERSDAEFTHSLCPDCAKRLYPDHYGKK